MIARTPKRMNSMNLKRMTKTAMSVMIETTRRSVNLNQRSRKKTRRTTCRHFLNASREIQRSKQTDFDFASERMSRARLYSSRKHRQENPFANLAMNI